MRNEENYVERKTSIRDLLVLVGPILVVFGGIISVSGAITELKGSITRIEASLGNLRETDARIFGTLEPDVREGIKRETRLQAVERRVDACCPLWENGRRR